MGRIIDNLKARRRMFVLKGRFPLETREMVFVIGRRHGHKSILVLEKKVRKEYTEKHDGAECITWIV